MDYGHFPDGVRLYHLEETTNDERRGDWHLRQLNGSANIAGRRGFHVLSGHLGYQIEHHLFPDLPATRYPEIAAHVREICARYGQAYNTGRFSAQLASVVRLLVAKRYQRKRHAGSLEPPIAHFSGRDLVGSIRFERWFAVVPVSRSATSHRSLSSIHRALPGCPGPHDIDDGHPVRRPPYRSAGPELALAGTACHHAHDHP